MPVVSTCVEGRGKKGDWASANPWGALDLRHLFGITPTGDKRTWSLDTGINQSLEMQNFSKMRTDLGRGICSVEVFSEENDIANVPPLALRAAVRIRSLFLKGGLGWHIKASTTKSTYATILQHIQLRFQ